MTDIHGTIHHMARQQKIPIKNSIPVEKKTLPKFAPDDVITIHAFNSEQHSIETVRDFKSQINPTTKKYQYWIHVSGLHYNSDALKHICEAYKLHSFTLEDIGSRYQRPKIELFDEYIYITLKDAYYRKHYSAFHYHQVNIIIGKGYILTFADKNNSFTELLEKRLSSDHHHIRQYTADYLAYEIIDIVIDNYLRLLHVLSNRTEYVEHSFTQPVNKDTLKSLYHIKKEVISFRRMTWPVKDIIVKLEQIDSPLIHHQHKVFIQDIKDHMAQIRDTLEMLSDMVADMLDLYQSMASNHMNEIVKVLTIISTIFIPLTFITGIYGMNFDNIPELHWRWGYAFVWGLILIIATGMVIYFKRKKWW